MSAVALTASARAPQAEEPAIELLWHACPYLLGTAANVALKKLQLPPDDIAAIADFACTVAQAYQKVAANPPSAPPDDPRTAEEIFCEGSTLDYCAGVRGAAPMSAAFRCWMNGLTVEQCAVEAIRSEAERR
jgi:hypothetical protein